METLFLRVFEQRRLGYMSTKDLLNVTTINREEPNIWEADMVLIQILQNFIFGPSIESPGISTVIIHTKTVEF